MPTTTQSTDYGYTSTFSGRITLDEGQAWIADVKAAIEGKSAFGQVIDLRGQAALGEDLNALVQDAMGHLLGQGMKRSAVILSSAVKRMQIMRLAKEVGMYAYERYFTVGEGDPLPASVLAWVVDGIDPDLGERA